MLNSKSRRWPDGIANSSGQLGRNLCDHLYGESANGHLPQLRGQPSFPDNVGDNAAGVAAALAESQNPHEENFVGGYSVYPGGGCTEYPWDAVQAEGFGSAYKREVRRRYPSPVNFTIQAPSLPSPTNYRRSRSRGERPLWNSGRATAFPLGRECAADVGAFEASHAPS